MIADISMFSAHGVSILDTIYPQSKKFAQYIVLQTLMRHATFHSSITIKKNFQIKKNVPCVIMGFFINRLLNCKKWQRYSCID